MPIHQGAHWCLAVVDLERQELKYYDSMAGDDFKCLDRIRSIFLLHVVIANSDFFVCTELYCILLNQLWTLRIGEWHAQR